MSRVGIGIRPPKKRALGIVDVNVLIIHHLGWQASNMFWGHLSEMLYRASEATTFVNTCRLIVTNRPDMDNCRVAGVVERSSLDTAYLRQQIGGLSSGLMITFHESTS